MRSIHFVSFFAGIVTLLFSLQAEGALPADFEKSVATIQTVGPEGQDNAKASAAWQAISQAGPEAILPLMQAMEESGPLARNWLRSAIEVIVERETAADRPLPTSDLGAFLLDARQNPQARRMAFDLVAQADPETAEKLIPGMLNDPSTELRRDAVQRLMNEGQSLAEAGNTDAAVLIFRQALNAARDVDQIEKIAGQLTDKLGQEIDLPSHFGFLMRWQVIGSFDNTGKDGFDTIYPPENSVDLNATYPGKESEARWQPYATSDPYGKVDLNQPFGLLKEVVGYAFTEFNSAEARPAELRLSCKNAWKIWLNGELVFGRDEYHRGQRIDQYKLPVQLQAGSNTILIKLCQNEQEENWTVEWEFKLRVCDETGTAILSTDRLPTPKPAEAPRRRRGAEK